MLRIIQGFKVLTRDAIDNRITLTKEEMRNINDNQMPDKYFAICKDDGMLYIYNKAAIATEDTGKYSLYSSSKISTIRINGKEIPIDDNGNIDIPFGDKNKFGVFATGNGLIANDGILTIDFNTIEDDSISINKVDFNGLILDAND